MIGKNGSRTRTRLSSLVALEKLFIVMSVLLLNKQCELAAISGDFVCQTADCVNTASHILNLMNATVNPCDDFYEFACGNFVKNAIIPEDRIIMNIDIMVGKKLKEQLLSLFLDTVDSNDPEAFNAVKRFYKTCMDETQIEADGIAPMVSIVNRLGGWPVLDGDQWDSESWNWTWATKQISKIGLPTDRLFKVSVDYDYHNSSIRLINIDLPETTVKFETMDPITKRVIVKKYYEYMVDVATIFGANRTRAQIELLESLNFEVKMSNLPHMKDYIKYELWQLQKLYPYVPWVEYINALLPSPLSVDMSQVVVVWAPSYFNALGRLLNTTPKRVTSNFLMWKMIEYSTNYLTEELNKRRYAFEAMIYGKQKQPARWITCTDATNERFPVALGAMYARKFFHQNSKAAVLEIVNGVRYEFEGILQKASWMDEKTRQEAIAKLHAMTTYIGYPDEFLDNYVINAYYKNLQLYENNYLLANLMVSKFETHQKLSLLRTPSNRNDWNNFERPTTVNAFYSPNKNSIKFPAGILQGQYFSVDAPRYLNFGAIGSVIGHEITHGFDHLGRLFDLNGNVNNWWQPETKEHFLEKVKCIIEQYNNFTDPMNGRKLNGDLMQGENIADNGGIKEAYLAYQNWQQTNGLEPSLPGLDYTPQQMFWISAAQTRCTSYNLEMVKNMVSSARHPPNQFRVLGPFRNRKEFANDFNCPIASPMNPVLKCEVW